MTYMSEVPHDFHLVIDFLIQDPVFHEASLVQLFCRIDGAMLLCRQFVDSRKGTLADLSSHIVHGATCPVHAVGIGDRPGQNWRGYALPGLGIHGSRCKLLNALKIAKRILRVLYGEALSRRNANDKSHLVRGLISRYHLNDRAIGEHATVFLLGFPKATAVYNGSIRGRIL